MPPFVFNILPLILVISGIIIRYTGYDFVGFLLVTIGFALMVVRKWMDKNASNFLKYLYSSILVLYIYMYFSAA